jgi:hypothetical protein
MDPPKPQAGQASFDGHLADTSAVSPGISPSKLALMLELATRVGNRLENDEPDLVHSVSPKVGERDFSSISFWDVDGIPVVSKGETAVALDKESPRRASLPRGPGGDSTLLSKESFSTRFPDAIERLLKATW